jgi:hypothetical protein
VVGATRFSLVQHHDFEISTPKAATADRGGLQTSENVRLAAPATSSEPSPAPG